MQNGIDLHFKMQRQRGERNGDLTFKMQRQRGERLLGKVLVKYKPNRERGLV